jgi:hypothetical protein
MSRTKRIGPAWEQPPSEHDLCQLLVELLGAVIYINLWLLTLDSDLTLLQCHRCPTLRSRCLPRNTLLIQDSLYLQALAASTTPRNERLSKRCSALDLCNNTHDMNIRHWCYGWNWGHRGDVRARYQVRPQQSLSSGYSGNGTAFLMLYGVLPTTSSRITT